MPDLIIPPGNQGAVPLSRKRRVFFFLLLSVLGMIVGGIVGGAVGYAIDDAPTSIPYWGFPYNQYGLKAGLGCWAGIHLGAIAGITIGVVFMRKRR